MCGNNTERKYVNITVLLEESSLISKINLILQYIYNLPLWLIIAGTRGWWRWRGEDEDYFFEGEAVGN